MRCYRCALVTAQTSGRELGGPRSELSERERWSSQMVLQAAARQAPKGSGWGLFSGCAAVSVCHLNFPDPEKVPSFVSSFPLRTHSHTQEQERVSLLRSTAAENSNCGNEEVQSSYKSVCLQVDKPESNRVIYNLWGSVKYSDRSMMESHPRGAWLRHRQQLHWRFLPRKWSLMVFISCYQVKDIVYSSNQSTLVN